MGHDHIKHGTIFTFTDKCMYACVSTELKKIVFSGYNRTRNMTYFTNKIWHQYSTKDQQVIAINYCCAATNKTTNKFTSLQYSGLLTFNVCTNPLTLSSEFTASKLFSKSKRTDGNLSITHPLIYHITHMHNNIRSEHRIILHGTKIFFKLHIFR